MFSPILVADKKIKHNFKKINFNLETWLRSCYAYHLLRQSCQESSKEPADVEPGVAKPQKSLFFT